MKNSSQSNKKKSQQVQDDEGHYATLRLLIMKMIGIETTAFDFLKWWYPLPVAIY